MRIAFMGTPEFAVPTLEALVAAGHDVVAVYTQPPRPANRGKRLSPSAVQARAVELGLEVRCPVSLRHADALAEFDGLNLDAAVVAAYGLILPQGVLDAPEHGCINVHASLLPRWRGAAPIQRAILAGDTETGICIMQMEAGLDTGPVRARWNIPVGDNNTAKLTRKLAVIGAKLVVDVLADLNAHPPIPQPETGVTYAAKIDKSEARIDFSKSASLIERQIDAFNPAPGAFFEYQGERIKILVAKCEEGIGNIGEVLDNKLTIACGDDVIVPQFLQRSGKPAMPAPDFLRGKPIPVGTILA